MCNNISEAFDGARVGSILRERNLSSRITLRAHKFRVDCQRCFSLTNQFISSFAPERSDQAFNSSFCQGERNEVGRVTCLFVEPPPSNAKARLRPSERRKALRRQRTTVAGLTIVITAKNEGIRGKANSARSL